MNFELTARFQEAFKLMEVTKKNILITGRAGTGKSTLLDYLRNNTKKNVVVLAPTGVSALNVRGQTIHSFFKFKPDITVDKVKKVKGASRNIYKELDVIMIDEISMVRADLLDCVDKFLRLNRGKKNIPFGGAQMIFFGDLYQLPPVVRGEERKIFNNIYSNPYFFESRAFKNSEFEFIELDKIFRQQDREFIEILNSIRNNTVKDEHLRVLNSRVNPHFEPPSDEFYIQLTTTNKLADEINRRQMEKLNGRIFRYRASCKGEFDEGLLPADFILEFKKGSQVMLLNNDSYGRWINGTVGKVKDVISEGDDIVIIEIENGEEVEVTPYTWNLFQFYFDTESKLIKTRNTGSFTQYPFTLAWAITIHKSQGKTFDKVIIDIGHGTFAHGQVYVALSRCRTLDGIVLKKPIEKKHIFMDRRVVKFITEFQYRLSEKSIPLEDKIKIIEDALRKNRKLRITYLKASDEKSTRVIHPIQVGEMEFGGKRFLGIRALDSLRGEERTFRVDRILEIKEHV